MRVISGIARRTPLSAPEGERTRPTADIAREGLFNILSESIGGAVFLDLFCGSGAVGIEALSRGADIVWFVDYWIRAIESTQQNLHRAKLTAHAHVLKESVPAAINHFAENGQIFDMVFMDAPYDNIAILNKSLKVLADTGILDGTLIIETEKKAKGIDIPEDFTVLDTRDYGRTRFLICTSQHEVSE